jgi:lysophospholipase
MHSTDTTVRDVLIPTADGLDLHAQYWAIADPRGVVVVAHGFGEHGNWYDHVARAVGPAAGVDFVAVDLRGHGRSPGRRGVVQHYDELTADLTAAFEWAGRERPGLPRFVLGHSNGGQVALRAALDPRFGPAIDGLILSNPSLRLSVQVPGYKLRLGRFLLRRAPWITLGAPLHIEKLTSDPAMQKLRRDDRLSHSRISPPFFFGMVEGGDLIALRAGEIQVPVLMILGGADTIIDPVASRAIFERLGSQDKTLLLFPGMLHEPFNEIGREQVFADLTGWLDHHLPNAS